MKEQRIVVALEWVLRGISLVAIVFSLYLLLQQQFLVYSLGALSSVSLGAVGALFILSEYSFSKYGGMNKLDAIIFGILFPAAFLATYEIIYHFSFLPAPNSSLLSLLGTDLRYLATEGVVILPLVFLRKKLAFTRLSAALLVIFAAMWIVWLLYGFPQYFLRGNGLIYTPLLFKTTDPWHTSLFYNFGSKAVLAVFFASLLKISYWKEIEDLIIKRIRHSQGRTQVSG